MLSLYRPLYTKPKFSPQQRHAVRTDQGSNADEPIYLNNLDFDGDKMRGDLKFAIWV